MINVESILPSSIPPREPVTGCTGFQVQVHLRIWWRDYGEYREARERLRDAVTSQWKYPEPAKAHKPRSPWQWVKGSAGEKEARNLFKS
jgi:hypothetical protein